MAYPGDLEEFATTLNRLQITHEERSLLEEILRLEWPANTISRGNSNANRRRVSQQSTVDHIHHCKSGHVSKHRRQTTGTSVGGIRSTFNARSQRTEMGSKESMETSGNSPGSCSSHALVEGDHLAFAVPWQDSDLHFWAEESSSNTSANAATPSDIDQSGSPSAMMNHSTPSDDCTEEAEELCGFIKIPWSDDTME